MQNNNLQQMQSNTYNGGVICSTMQNLQVVNNAESANCQQLTRQHSITLSLFQFDLIYGPSTDRIGGPAIRSPWCPVPVTAPGEQTGSTCRTLRILQDLARPLPGTAGGANVWKPPGAVVPGVCPIATKTHVHP